MAAAAVAAAAAAEAIAPPGRTELMLLDQEMRDIYRAASRRSAGERATLSLFTHSRH